MTFSVVQNVNTSADGLNNDLVKINIWAYQWKISFKPDQNNQAQGVVFSRKINKKKTIPLLSFNKNNASEANSQKHLDIIPDNSLSL